MYVLLNTVGNFLQKCFIYYYRIVREVPPSDGVSAV